MLSTLKQLVFALIIVSLPGSYFLPSAAAQEIPSVLRARAQYVVKLPNADTSVLAAIATNIDQKFSFSQNPNFRHVFGFTSSLSLAALRTALAGKFIYLEEDQSLIGAEVDATLLPDDPGFTNNGANIDKQWGLVKANFVEAWSKTKGSREIVVAVIDTGVDGTHEDFSSARVSAGYDVIANKGISRGANSDDNGHGTLISGVIGARTDNGVGIAGAVWNVTIMPIKALNAKGVGSSSNISEAIVWAADNDASVINLSLGGFDFAHDTTLANAIAYAFNKNIVIVAAAGNDAAAVGGNLDLKPVFPICNDNGQNMVIGVTATDVNDLKPDFANFGKACVDVSAPGRRILSTINYDPVNGASAPDSYARASGTSLAVPFVSAQAVLLKALFPDATNRQIRDRIIASADTIDELNLSQCNSGSCRGLLGGGRINVAKSLEQEFVRVQDGDAVMVFGTDNLFYINGGKRQLITELVRTQRFVNVTVKSLSADELAAFPEGSNAEPLDGTLIKSTDNPTVFYMSKGLKLPVTNQIFTLLNLKFTDITTLSSTEVNSWITGSLLTPPEGSLVRSTTNPTVYWTVGTVLHPINYKFWVERGLSIFPVVYVSDTEIAQFTKGDPYILN
ncbi:MAG: S8 family serine peptidase [bacterium]|nr:S8 family serine peptidase [bacterium]